MSVKFICLVVPALLLVGGMCSSAHAQHLKNGNFNANPPTQSWTVDPPNLKTADGVTGKCIWLNHSGQANHDPSVSQDMTNLKVGSRYVVLGQYKVGADAYAHAKPGDKMLAIDIDGVTMTTLVAPSDKKDPTKLAGSTWLEFGVTFTATKTQHMLRLRGEIEGKDADVYIDNVSVTVVPDTIKNGNFDKAGKTATSAESWTFENIDEKFGGYKTEKLKDGKTNGYIWINFVGKDKDPAVKQTLSGLKVGATYTVSCQYRTGWDAQWKKEIKPGTPLLTIDIDGAEKNRAFAASAKGDPNKTDRESWNSLTARFTATKAQHELRIRAEIDGMDGDADVDNVSVVESK